MTRFHANLHLKRALVQNRHVELPIHVPEKIKLLVTPSLLEYIDNSIYFPTFGIAFCTFSPAAVMFVVLYNINGWTDFCGEI